MTVDVKHSIEIGRPAAEVFEFVADFANNPQWQAGMKSCEWTSDDAMVEGSTYVQVATFLGRRIDTHFRVTAVDEGRSISIESTKSTFPIQVTRSVEPVGENRCRVTAHVRGQPTGILKLFSGMVRKSVVKDYEKLRSMLEDQDSR